MVLLLTWFQTECFNVFTKRNPSRGIWDRCTDKGRDKDNGIRWCILQKNSNLLSMDFLHFFAKSRKSLGKMIHQKKNKVHRTSKIVKSRQRYSNGYLPYHSLFILLRASMQDVACEFACAVWMRRNNWRQCPNIYFLFFVCPAHEQKPFRKEIVAHCCKLLARIQ